MGRRAISDAQKERRRQAILDAAAALFRETSFEAVTMAQVAEEAGVAKGTVYLYFNTKEELFLALQTQAFEAWFDDVDAELAARAGECDVDAVVTIVGETLGRRPDLVRLIAILHTILERNVEYETALAFKRMLRERVLHTGPLLESCLPFLEEGEGAQLLLRLHALVIGFQHMAAPAPVVRDVLAEPELALFTVDFDEELLATLRTLLMGLQHERGRTEHE